MLPAAEPERCGIASGAVLDFVDAVESAGLDPHSLVLVRHGRVAAAGWWAPYRADDITLLYSLSKSFTATAVGFAAAEGRIDLDRTLASYFPDAPAGPRAGRIQVRHLLCMATGHEVDTLHHIDPDDPVGSFLAIEPDAEPGTLFTYHNAATLMLSVLVGTATGQDLVHYLRPRLLRPLGIDRLHWQRTGAFRSGFSGLHLTTESVARFGQTYLSGGEFAGRTVLPPGWAAQASAVHVDNARWSHTADWQQGYGFQFWRSRHGYRGDGACGQFCLILPEQDLVLASTGAMADMQAYLDLVWRVLLPGVGTAPLPASSSAAARLADRLVALSLPTPTTGRTGEPPTEAQVPDASGVPFTLRGDPAGALRLTGADVRRSATGWTLTLVAGRARYPIPVTAAGFTRTEHPVGDAVLTLAGAGGWASDGRFVADVVLVNTPHRFRLTGDPATGVAETAWHIEPLQSLPLSGRGVPRVPGVA